ncbi:MAG: DUF1778 domain-containing protein [Bdellovibrionota bacterium]
MSIESVQKDARISIRLESHQKEIIDNAAELNGQTTSAFILDFLLEKARDVVKDHQQTCMLLEDAKKLIELLEQSEEPTHALELARDRFQKKKFENDVWAFMDLSKLPKTSNRKNFYCEFEPFQNFFREYPSQFEQKSLTKVYVALYKEDDLIGGYYSLNTTFFEFPNLKRKLKMLQIKRIAVDPRVIGMGVHELLLLHAMEKIVSISTYYNDIFGVEVSTQWRSADKFYRQYGFKYLNESENKMYLSFKTFKNLFN